MDLLGGPERRAAPGCERTGVGVRGPGPGRPLAGWLRPLSFRQIHFAAKRIKRRVGVRLKLKVEKVGKAWDFVWSRGKEGEDRGAQ